MIQQRPRLLFETPRNYAQGREDLQILLKECTKKLSFSVVELVNKK